MHNSVILWNRRRNRMKGERVFRRKGVPVAIKYALKHVVWTTLCKHTPSERPDIFILTSRRSGGSWVTELLSADRGLRQVMQPLSNGWKDFVLQAKGVFPKTIRENKYVPIHGRDDAWLKTFLDAILSGKLCLEHQWNPFDGRFCRHTNRVCVKLHNIKHWVDWLEANYPACKIIYLLRHPVPQILSTRATGWGNLIESYLNDPVLGEGILTSDQLEYSRKIAESGTDVERYAVNWAIENAVPIRRVVRNPNVLTLTYEEMVLDPAGCISLLTDRLSLSYAQSLLDRSTRPSQTVLQKSTLEAMRNLSVGEERSHYLIGRWKNSASRDDVRAIFNILDRLCINVYHPDRVIASREFLNLEGTEKRAFELSGKR